MCLSREKSSVAVFHVFILFEIPCKIFYLCVCIAKAMLHAVF